MCPSYRIEKFGSYLLNKNSHVSRMPQGRPDSGLENVYKTNGGGAVEILKTVTPDQLPMSRRRRKSLAAQPPNNYLFTARVFLEEEGGAEHTLEQAPQGGPRVFLEEEGPNSSRPQTHIRASPSPHSSRPRRGDPEYFWRRAALRLLPWTRAGFKTVLSDFGGGGGQFLFEVTSTRAADFGGRRRSVRP